MALPPLNEENAAPGTPLRGYNVSYTRETIETFLARTGESMASYEVDGRQRVPPGMLFGAYGRLIHGTFHYEAGVHVSSDVTLHRPPLMDEPLRVDGEIRELYERNGNKYVVFSVDIAAAETHEPVATVVHTSIYALRKKSE